MNEPPQCVVAIDIGSSGCGYAFSADYTFCNNPCDVSTYRWFAEVGKFTSLKTPAAILFDSKQEFVSFGYNAQEKYITILESSDKNNWYYIEGFKMALYSAVESGEDIRDDFSIKEMSGKAVSAKTVFSSAIKYFYDHFLTEVQENNLGFQREKIHWIISVPAIWTDSCKQFMRESAIMAGIPGKQFSLVYEPEAASIYARFLQINKVDAGQNQTILKTFQPGTKLLVVDAGGGTVDISAQQVLDGNDLKIIHKVRGGDYGGNTVNMAFRQMLFRLFSGPSLLKFKKEYPIDYMEMMRSFERTKIRPIKPDDKTVSTMIAAPLLEISEEDSECNIHEIINSSQYAGELRVKRDKLLINLTLFKEFFEHSLNELVIDMQEVLEHKRCADVSAVMLVGGFAECELLRKTVTQTFPQKEVFVPHEGGLSVLRGAVIYGHTPQIVSSRICNYTYGIAVSKPFKADVMPMDKCYEHDGELWCRDMFEVSYKIDTVVNIGDKKQIELNDTFLKPEVQHRREEPLRVDIVISDKEDPTFITDEGCRKHAMIIVQPPKGQWPQIVRGYVEFEIAGTEMIGSYINSETNDRTSIIIEFLPRIEHRVGNDSERRRVFDPDRIDTDNE
ncbi:heat shock 70 kDa protein 12A-like [Mytilus edulis]